MGKKMFVLLLLCLPLAFCSAQDYQGAQAPGAQVLAETSRSIREKLLLLKQESSFIAEQLGQVTKDLTETSESLRKSESEKARLLEQSTMLSLSLTSINEELSGCYETITRQEERLTRRARAIRWLAALLILRYAGMAAGYVLYARGVRLPRWLDILL